MKQIFKAAASIGHESTAPTLINLGRMTDRDIVLHHTNLGRRILAGSLA